MLNESTLATPERASSQAPRCGVLAMLSGRALPIRVCKSPAGYFIGTIAECGLPFSRESAEYFSTRARADDAFDSGDWTQRTHA